MSFNTFGKLFRFSTWGESHGPAIGCIVDGCPPNINLSEKDIQKELDKRKPGQSKFTTQRKEDDKVQILSGVFDGRTTGTPISLIIYNKDMRSKDYGNIKDKFRPGHADFTYFKKYGIRYPRGVGVGVELPSIEEKVEIGKGRIIQNGSQVCLLNLGTRLEECKLAAEHLKQKGVSTTIVDARFAKPLDEELIIKCAREHEILVSIEEGSIGGFGSHVKNLLSEKGIFDKGLKFRSMNLPDKFIEQNTPEKMYEIAGLNASQISEKILDILFNKNSIKVVKN